MNDLNGATPVPGPTIITGVLSSGKLMVPFLTHTGTFVLPKIDTFMERLHMICTMVKHECHIYWTVDFHNF